MLLFSLNCAPGVCGERYSISNMSPKSESAANGVRLAEDLETSQPSVTSEWNSITTRDKELDPTQRDHNHERVERSAAPIINDVSSQAELKHVDDNGVESSSVSGRTYSTIEPTTLGQAGNDLLAGEMTQKVRFGKDLESESFLVKGGPSRTPTITATPTSPAVVPDETSLPKITSGPRQSANPDIQDIITGIVKLLNGNVNVHANTQVTRRPIATRINNRGPPRISEVQLGGDYETTPTSSLRPPPPYPFDRPEGPVRPFLTGVPIPEQIVPSMQQNYRPGFISQNRPPWQRPRPRPPIGGNTRRPIPPPYKPLPLAEHQLGKEPPTVPAFTTPSAPDIPTDSNATDTNLDVNTYEVAEESVEGIEEIPKKDSTEEETPNKEELSKKKDKPKSTEKKPIIPVTPFEVTTSTEMIQLSSSTLLETSSSDVADTSSILLESSIEEVPVLSSMSTEMLETVAEMTKAPVDSSTVVFETPSSTLESSSTSLPTQPYHPRPGIVLDDPEFKPGQGRPGRPQQRPTKHHPYTTAPVHPPGYGEIFDVTLSAIQGPTGGNSGVQTVNIKPFNAIGSGDIIVSPTGDEGFVSIDGKRTYINLFGEPTEAPTPTIKSTSSIKPTPTIPPGQTGTGYAVAETESVKLPPRLPHYRPRPQQQPPVRIDTCIVGDDSTCDQAQNEKCKTDNGVSSCHCRPGFSRRKHREPCRKVVSLMMSLRVDRIYERRVVWDLKLADKSSEAYGQLSFETMRAVDSAMSMTPFSDEFMDVRVNSIYNGDPSKGTAGVFVNVTLQLEENGDTLRPQLKGDIQRHLLGVIHRRNNNIGNSALYVESPPGSVTSLQDLDECTSAELNDCHPEAICSNIWGSFRCDCGAGLRDPWADQPQRAGRSCQSCPDTYCNNRGTCSYDASGAQSCSCVSNYYGAQCEIDGEVLGVAIGASVAAVIIIVLTLVCLVMWSRRWHREQKNAIGSPVFGYMAGTQVKTPVMGQAPYQMTLEDRMRWAQIADVMAQANHYAAEPVAASTRPSSAVFGYPGMQTMASLSGMSMAGTLPIHSSTMPPVPLPRLTLNNRSSGMRTLENSSSSEEEDRTDLLGRSFQVPRPKSRSNASITTAQSDFVYFQNQSGIYYDVDYEPNMGDMYGGGGAGPQTASNHPIPGPQGIPMSTYTSGRAPASYYMK
ncbi:EGF-like calcium-binding, conserved site [Sergentomyia squamirostris]